MDRPKMLTQLTDWMVSGQARLWRQRATWTVETAAQKLGVGTSTLNRWEANQAHPRGQHAEAYHQFLTRCRSYAEKHTNHR